MIQKREGSEILKLKNLLKERQRELEKVRAKFKKMGDEWESRLQYSRRGLEVTNRELARVNSKLALANKELEEARSKLEEKVKQRTKELQGRIDELERYHRLTVGRELKMVELKKEIKILKKEKKE